MNHILDKTYLSAVRNKDISLKDHLIAQYCDVLHSLPILEYQGGEKCSCKAPATWKVRGEKYYCDKCVDEVFVCDVCGSMEFKSVIIGNKLCCISCYEKRNKSPKCIHCNAPTKGTYEGKPCCADCFLNRFGYCSKCNKLLPYEEFRQKGDYYYCLECIRKSYDSIMKRVENSLVKCTACANLLTQNQGGTPYCDECGKVFTLDGEPIKCDSPTCNEMASTTFRDKHYCNDCYHNNVHICEECVGAFTLKEVVSVGDHNYCFSCLGKQQSVVIIERDTLDDLYLVSLGDYPTKLDEMCASLDHIYNYHNIEFPEQNFKIEITWKETKTIKATTLEGAFVKAREGKSGDKQEVSMKSLN